MDHTIENERVSFEGTRDPSSDILLDFDTYFDGEELPIVDPPGLDLERGLFGHYAWFPSHEPINQFIDDPFSGISQQPSEAATAEDPWELGDLTMPFNTPHFSWFSEDDINSNLGYDPNLTFGNANIDCEASLAECTMSAPPVSSVITANNTANNTALTPQVVIDEKLPVKQLNPPYTPSASHRRRRGLPPEDISKNRRNKTRPEKCHMCGKGHPWPRDLKRHLKTNHPEEAERLGFDMTKIKCGYCGHPFDCMRSDRLKRHIRRIHEP